jgi:hypothetical protein
MNILKMLFSNKKEPKQPAIPDLPIGFGYKNKWLAIKSTNNAEVAEFLNIQNIEIVNWEMGVNAGYGSKVFITPPLNGWVLVLGVDISDVDAIETKELLESVSKTFGECQIFSTHRVSDYHFWALAKQGEIMRMYAIAGAELLVMYGEPTEVEQKYKLIDMFPDDGIDDSFWENENLTFPDEELVMEIAESWSINPTKIEELNNVEGLGLTGD